jgi:hypothetical protein
MARWDVDRGRRRWRIWIGQVRRNRLFDQNLHLYATVQRRALELSAVLFGTPESYGHFSQEKKISDSS